MLRTPTKRPRGLLPLLCVVTTVPVKMESVLLSVAVPSNLVEYETAIGLGVAVGTAWAGRGPPSLAGTNTVPLAEMRRAPVEETVPLAVAVGPLSCLTSPEMTPLLFAAPEKVPETLAPELDPMAA